MTETALRQTPLHQAHLDAGGRMVPFAGWDMPVQYSGILDEARAVRSGAGLFDVSHMGRLLIEGPGAAEFLNRVLSNNVPKLRLGRARYGVICDEAGGIIDDCIVYRLDEERYMLVPNASNTAAVVDWIGRWAPGKAEATLSEVTGEMAMIAVQGPDAISLIQRLVDIDLTEMKLFSIIEARIDGVLSTVARTGYTGEDGAELFVPAGSAAAIWSKLTDGDAVPCGLGARDVLRLEAGLLLHGNDMDTSVNPYEAGLDRFVSPDRQVYIAGPALRRIRDLGPTRHIVGLAISGRRPVRSGCPILSDGERVGTISSGTYSPTLDRNIAMGYVPTALDTEGTALTVDVRGNTVEAVVASLPFYSRPR
jgi:aminomethyltransferase